MASAEARGLCACLPFLFGAPGQQALKDAPPAMQFDSDVVRQQVQDLIAAEMNDLEESLGSELQNALERLMKADEPSTSALGSSAVPLPPTRPSTDFSVNDGELLPRHRHADVRRRWTCAVDGAESLNSIIRKAASDAANYGRNGHSKTANMKAQLKKMVSFEKGGEDESDPEREEEPPSGSDYTRVSSPSSSVPWRIDALDCGDRLASSAAAKKGSASVDSIVDLVQSERERWDEERYALEARLEDIKEQRRRLRVGSVDMEKEALKMEVQYLRGVMKQRSRFGAWVCERHMQESDEEDASPSYQEKEELRETMASLEAEIRDARKARR